MGKAVELDSTVLLSLAVDEADAGVVDSGVLASDVVDAPADVGSNVMNSVAADARSDVVDPAVVISTDADTLADSVVSTPVTPITVDDATDELDIDVTSGGAELPL